MVGFNLEEKHIKFLEDASKKRGVSKSAMLRKILDDLMIVYDIWKYR